MTYGMELEFADCNRGIALPCEAKWNFKDNTCVNSNGIANDPHGELYKFGGEINTKPTNSLAEQVDNFIEIVEAVKPSINYRCNLHIHIGVPGLINDLDLLKNIFIYWQQNKNKIFSLVQKIPVPKSTDPEIFKWENIRYRRMLVSHQYSLPKKRCDAIINSKSPKQFFEEHAPLTSSGRMWHFSPRPSMNMRQLWETDTIEFRHFAGTLDPEEIKSSLIWCSQLIKNLPDPAKLIDYYNFKFPTFCEYNYKMEQCYQWTNFATNSRTEVKNRLSKLREVVNIDSGTFENLDEVYNSIVYLRGDINNNDNSDTVMTQNLFPSI